MGNPASTAVLVVDVDGVVSPVHGATLWADDVVAGAVFGPVAVSPTLCARLDAVAAAPWVTAVWLTDWDVEMRTAMSPWPGRTWPALADPEEGRLQARERAGVAWSEMPWWKWWMLSAWLDDHPGIGTVVWCDDDLALPAAGPDQEPDVGGRYVTRADVCGDWLRARGLQVLLIAPDEDRGLSPAHLSTIERALAPEGHRVRGE